MVDAFEDLLRYANRDIGNRVTRRASERGGDIARVYGVLKPECPRITARFGGDEVGVASLNIRPCQLGDIDVFFVKERMGIVAEVAAWLNGHHLDVIAECLAGSQILCRKIGGVYAETILRDNGLQAVSADQQSGLFVSGTWLFLYSVCR